MKVGSLIIRKIMLYITCGLFLNTIGAISHVQQLVGGFGAPVFFTSYNKSAIDAMAITPNAKVIKITYPKELKSLAVKIKHELNKKAAIRVKVESQELNLVDTSTTKYRHDAVIVTVWFK